MNDGTSNLQDDVKSCRSSCRSMDADYFSFNQDNNACWCKSSNAGRMQGVGIESGETSCSGEMRILINCFCETFYSRMCTVDYPCIYIYM